MAPSSAFSDMDPAETAPNSPRLKEDVFKFNGFDHEDIAKMANIIDKFRESGLEEEISLPQLVVAGNQSAGKSSLLESLTGLPFPVGMGVCTRFATQVNLRRSYDKRVTASLSNISETSKAESGDKRIFPKDYADEINAEEFSGLLEEASAELGLEASNTGSQARNEQRFAKSILKIEVSGPERQFLSFVDTPGLFHSKTKNQGVDDATEVKDLVLDLISDPRSIIVVVMDSRNEPSTQDIFNLVETVDPTYSRTVGVLTKCDTLSSQADINYAFQIANNEILDLKHGWFVVKNKSSDDQETGTSMEIALRSEREFFSRPKWRDINPRKQGVVQLRNFLSSLFARHVSSEFPKLLTEMRSKLKKAQKQLAALGSARSTQEQQKKYLLQASRRYLEIINECNSGGFLDSRDSRIHLWQHIKEHEQLFETRITSDEGRLRKFMPLGEVNYGIEKRAGRSSKDLKRSGDGEKFKDIYSWINKEYHQSAGPECSFLIQPRLVDSLFKQQTSPWEEISIDFVHNLIQILNGVMNFATEQCCADVRIANRLKGEVLSLIDQTCQSAEAEVMATLAREQRRIRIHDDAKFAADIYRARMYRMLAAITPLWEEANKKNVTVIDLLQSESPEQLVAKMQGPQSAVFDIHDLLSIYYPIALERFKGNVVQIGDELVMGAKSPAFYLSSDWIESLSPEKLQYYAGEDEDTANERLRLQEKVQRLQDALALAEPVLLSLGVGPVIHQQTHSQPPCVATPNHPPADSIGPSPTIDSSNQTAAGSLFGFVNSNSGKLVSETVTPDVGPAQRSSFSTPSPYHLSPEGASKLNPFEVAGAPVTPPRTPDARSERRPMRRRHRSTDIESVMAAQEES